MTNDGDYNKDEKKKKKKKTTHTEFLIIECDPGQKLELWSLQNVLKLIDFAVSSFRWRTLTSISWKEELFSKAMIKTPTQQSLPPLQWQLFALDTASFRRNSEDLLQVGFSTNLAATSLDRKRNFCQFRWRILAILSTCTRNAKEELTVFSEDW